jgi:predicted N-acetyltransferase YhbS
VPFTLTTALPGDDSPVGPLLDRAFGASEQESRLVEVLAAQYPGFDAGLSLLAERDGKAVAYALFLPRTIRLRGADVPLAACGPVGVLPEHQGTGAGAFLMDAGLAALGDRGLVGSLLLGHSSYFPRFGYAPAFNLHVVRAPTEALGERPGEEGDTSAWRGIESDDLEPLVGLHWRCHRDVNGAERRSAAAMDWASLAAGSHTLVLPGTSSSNGASDSQGTNGAAGPAAYLRFRVRESVQITECGAREPNGVAAILAFAARLVREHARPQAEFRIPPAHPVSRELFRRGCTFECNNFGAAAMLQIGDWPGLFRQTAASWAVVLGGAGHRSISLEIEGATHHLSLKDGELRIGTERDNLRHLVIPDGWAPALVTGHRCAADLVFDAQVSGRSQLDPEGANLLPALFPHADPNWTYSTVYEVADG